MQNQTKIQTKSYGNAKFKKIVQDNQSFIELIQSKLIQNQLNRDEWDFQSGYYLIDKWNLVFKQMVQSQANKVSFYNNQYPQIINEIQNVKFINLQFLYLSRNNINNIESLNFIMCQNLEYLALDQNSISQIKCLNKSKMPLLKEILLNLNPINQVNSLTRANFNQDNIILTFEYNYGFPTKNTKYERNLTHNDLSLFVKLAQKNLIQLVVKAQNRIRQVKIYEILQRRYYIMGLYHPDFN